MFFIIYRQFYMGRISRAVGELVEALEIVLSFPAFFIHRLRHSLQRHLVYRNQGNQAGGKAPVLRPHPGICLGARQPAAALAGLQLGYRAAGGDWKLGKPEIPQPDQQQARRTPAGDRQTQKSAGA